MPSRFATQALFNQLAKQHNLAPEWHLHISTHAESGVGSLKSTAMGCCAYALRRIWISEALLTHGKWATVKDVIAHEVAHALTPGAGHGKLWKLMATKLGAKPAARQSVGDVANLALAQEPKYRKPRAKKPVAKWNRDMPVCGDSYQTWKQDLFALRKYYSRKAKRYVVQGHDLEDLYYDGMSPAEAFTHIHG